jgi:hypothetical protein
MSDGIPDSQAFVGVGMILEPFHSGFPTSRDEVFFPKVEERSEDLDRSKIVAELTRMMMGVGILTLLEIRRIPSQGIVLG